MKEPVCMHGGTQVIHKSRNKLIILGATGMSSSNSFIKGVQMLVATIQNSVATPT